MKDKKKKIVLFTLAIVGIMLITVGMTYAFFNYSKSGSKQNTIKNGNITFHYQEGNSSISIDDVMPMTDAQGKTQNNYFEFDITSATSNTMDIPYYITLRRTDDSDANMDSIVKVYLTKVDGSGNEEEVALGKYNSLNQYDNSIIDVSEHIEKLIYNGLVYAGTKNYTQKYRLRMWISDDAELVVQQQGQPDAYPYNGKTYTLKVNVYSNGNEINNATAQERKNVSIQSISVNNNTISKTNDVYYTVVGNDKATVEISTVSPNAKVEIVRTDYTYNNTIAFGNTNIKRLSTTKNYDLNFGENYFKITIKSEDGSTVSDPIKLCIKRNLIESIPGVTKSGNSYLLNTNDISNFVYCGNEDGNCTTPYPTIVAFGLNGQYVLKEISNTTINCSRGGFDNIDPINGVDKQCYYMKLDDFEIASIKINNTDLTFAAPYQYSAIIPENSAAQLDIVAKNPNAKIKVEQTNSNYTSVINSDEYQQTPYSNQFSTNYGYNYYRITVDPQNGTNTYAVFNLSIEQSIIKTNPDIYYEDGVYKLSTNDISNYTYCAYENQGCSVPYTTLVIYGGGGNYLVQETTTSVGCNKYGFPGTDPWLGHDKACYYLNK